MLNKVKTYGDIMDASHALAVIIAQLPTCPAQAKANNHLTECINFALKAAASVEYHDVPPVDGHEPDYAAHPEHLMQ